MNEPAQRQRDVGLSLRNAAADIDTLIQSDQWHELDTRELNKTAEVLETVAGTLRARAILVAGYRGLPPERGQKP